MQIATLAKRNWIRVQPNMALGAYEAHAATGQLDEPQWSELSPAEIYKLAFKDRFIGSFDHPVLKRLRGEV